MSICKNGRCETMLHEEEEYCENHKEKDTLADKARNFKTRKQLALDITDEQIELSLLWLKGEVNLSQTAVALFGSTDNVAMAYSVIANSLKEAHKQGIIK